MSDNETRLANVGSITDALAEPFPPSTVKVKPLKVAGNRAIPCFFIDARHVQERLDAVLGVLGWRDEYEILPDGNVMCKLSVKTETGDWITKTDVGGQSEQPDGGDRLKAAFCLPLDAVALTRDGWTPHDRLRVGDEVLGYDVPSRSCLWTPVTAVNVFEDANPVVELRSKSFNMDCTPQHRWVVHRREGGVSVKATADLDTRDKIVVAAPAVGGDHPLTAREAAIIGWVATDGSVSVRENGRNVHVCIHQSKPRERKVVRSLVGADGKEHVTPAGSRLFPGKTTASATMERGMFRLGQPFAKALLVKAGLWTPAGADWSKLPGLATRLTAESRDAMFDAMMMGDGQRAASGQLKFGKKRKPGVMAAFEILCTLKGIALGTLHGSSQPGKIEVRTLRENPHTWNKCITATPGVRQAVWCPTTGTGTWVTMWRGQITITGNSDALKRAAVKFGVGRYLYRVQAGWHDYDPQRRQFVNPPQLPQSAKPRAMLTAGGNDRKQLSAGDAKAAALAKATKAANEGTKALDATFRAMGAEYKFLTDEETDALWVAAEAEDYAQWLNQGPTLDAVNAELPKVSNMPPALKAAVAAKFKAHAEREGWAFDKDAKKYILMGG